jgi:hypothetical protein
MCRSPSKVETTLLVVANAVTKWKSSLSHIQPSRADRGFALGSGGTYGVWVCTTHEGAGSRSDRPLERVEWLGDGVPVIMDDTQWVLYVLSGPVTILG